MNILISILKFPPDFTGAGLRTARMYQNLLDSGLLDGVYVITSGSGAGADRVEPRRPGRQVVCRVGTNRYERTPRTPAEKLQKAIYVLHAGIRSIIQYLRLFRKVDLVHTIDSSWLSTIIGCCCYVTRKPLVKEIVLLGADDPLSIARHKKIPVRFFFLFPFRIADLVVVLSDRLKQSCLAFGIPAGKIWQRINPVYLDFSPEHGNGGEVAARLDAGRPWILHVGRISRRKNIEFLLRSAARLNGEVQLVFAGPWGDVGYKQEIIGLADRLHRATDGRIDAVFLGHISDRQALAHLFAKASLFWFASHSEGMPNVVLESLVSGTPVVTLALEGAVAEVIEPGNNGEVVQDADPAVFGAAVNRWLSRRDVDRGRISRRARKRFDPCTVEKEYLRRFREIVSTANDRRTVRG